MWRRILGITLAVLVALAFWRLLFWAPRPNVGPGSHLVPGWLRLALVRVLWGVLVAAITRVIGRRPWDALVACGIAILLELAVAMSIVGMWEVPPDRVPPLVRLAVGPLIILPDAAALLGGATLGAGVLAWSHGRRLRTGTDEVSEDGKETTGDHRR